MNTSSMLSQVATSPAPTGALWDNLYKVYANVEFLKHRGTLALEVIDGYLAEGESLEYTGSFCINNIHVISLNIKRDLARNTFLHITNISLATPSHSILVLVNRRKSACGYQWMDENGINLGKPVFSPASFESLLASLT